MTLDEAIAHALEVAEQEEKNSKTGKWFEGEDWNIKAREQCAECAADHRQLAKWLTELKDLREDNKVMTSECDRLIKEKGELLKKSEQIAEYKQLLKMAVEDISKMPCNNDTHIPESCYICEKHGNCSYTDSFKWCKADIALKLIGETNEP